jgi:hypothetical protein
VAADLNQVLPATVSTGDQPPAGGSSQPMALSPVQVSVLTAKRILTPLRRDVAAAHPSGRLGPATHHVVTGLTRDHPAATGDHVITPPAQIMSSPHRPEYGLHETHDHHHRVLVSVSTAAVPSMVAWAFPHRE